VYYVVDAVSEAAETKETVADVLSRNFSAYKTLNAYVDPVLGI